MKVGNRCIIFILRKGFFQNMNRKFFTIFEHHKQPLISRRYFFEAGVFRCAWAAFSLLAVSIFIGAAVYHYSEGFSWVDTVLET